VLYHFSHTSSPFSFNCFFFQISTHVLSALDCNPPTYTFWKLG
jgi:hypothetical protein